MHPACHRLLPLSIACCGALLLGLPTPAATAGAKPTAKTASVRPAPKQATPRQQLRGAAKGLALAAETVEAINEGQLDVASRVLTGESDCEFNQQISVQPLAGVPGYSPSPSRASVTACCRVKPPPVRCGWKTRARASYGCRFPPSRC